VAAEWARIANTTIHKYVRDVEDNIQRNRKLPAMLKSKGMITYNHSGDLINWRIKYKRAPMRVFRESDTLTFARINRWKQAELDWRGYAATDSVGKLEKLKNRGVEAIIKFYSEMAENLLEDITENFAEELWIDGNLAANAGKIHGLESIFSVSGGHANGFIGIPNDTYAGLSTALGNYGGSWSLNGANAEWPYGSGDPEYEFWSPLVVDYTDTAWDASTKTWPNTCLEALRFGIHGMMKNKSAKAMVDAILLERTLYRQFLNKLQTEEQVNVSRGENKDGLYALGFRDVVNFDGVDVTAEYSVPSTVGYGIAPRCMELMSMQDKLFVPMLPDFDIASQNERMGIDFYGNLRLNPKYLWKLDNVT
jgi:hypothetical protein